MMEKADKMINRFNEICCSSLSFDYYYALLCACSSGNISLFDIPLPELEELC